MKKLTTIACLLCLSLAMTACGSDDEGGPDKTATPATAVETAAPTPKMETITVFTIDTTHMTTVPSRVKKNEDDDSVAYIALLVADNLEDNDIRVADAYLDGENAVIVFNSKGKPLKNCSAEMETLILDCFSTSVLDNVDGCRGVIFRSDKGEYASDNLTLGEDEIYASK